MRQRINYYPIPVLVRGGDNYKQSSFDTEIDVVRDMHKVKIHLKTSLHNPELEALFNDGSIVTGCHVECSQCCYRRLFTTGNWEDDFYVDEARLNGKVEISTFLTATRDIPGYTSADFSEDYAGLSFDLQQGMRLGTGQWLTFQIEKSQDDFSDSSSIFSILLDVDKKHTELSIDYDERKIQIFLPEDAFNHYRALSRDPQYTEVLHGMLLIPALMKVFNDMKQSGTEGWQDSRWFLSLRNAYEKAGRNFDQAIQDGDPFEEAQKLLAGPLAKGLEKLTQGDDSYED
ncbi:hypothetical protein [Selenomonas ruminantium]|uniref:hypothetical protein n=1 Tax=Selenomonas ruminantium TaxID=971 RepID=UPI0026F3136B|nr:hypothetical protein [Selenomonas ruminantium]